MHTQSITARTVSALPPALVVQALDRLDDDGKSAIATRISDIIRRPSVWTKHLALALLNAIQEEMAEQADEACWLEREELRAEFQLGRY